MGLLERHAASSARRMLAAALPAACMPSSRGRRASPRRPASDSLWTGASKGRPPSFLLPLDKGYFKGAGLDVSDRRGGLSARADHPRRVRQLRHGLRRHQRTHQVSRPEPVAPIKAVFMVYNKPPYCDRGTQEPRHHRTQATRGQEAGRAAGRHNHRAMAAVRQAQQHRRVEGHDRERSGFRCARRCSPPDRSMPRLAFRSGSMSISRTAACRVDDIVLMPMADYGMKLYGNAIIVNSKFAAEKPEAVKASCMPS